MHFIYGKACRRNGLSTLALVLTAFAFAAPALAGDTLYFKSGAVDSRAEAALHASAAKPAGSAYYVVQFKDTIRAEYHQDLVTLGATILRYVPDDALIIRAKGQAANTIEKSTPSVAAILPMQPRWKISPDFEPVSVFNQNASQDVLIRLFEGETTKSTQEAIDRLAGAQVIETSDRSVIARVRRGEIETLAGVDAIEWIQPNPKIDSLIPSMLPIDSSVTTMGTGDYSDLNGMESGTKLMNMDTAWTRGFTGKGQIASMADTGMDTGSSQGIHGDFAGRVPVGYFFGFFSKSWEDPMGHGTHVAGSVMSSGAASGGIVKGGAYEATFVPESMWSPMLSGLSIPNKLADLFGKAHDEGARVHTNSWGTVQNLGGYDGLAQQVDEYMAANPDMLILFAAGNSGVDANKDGRVDNGSIGSPATAKNVLTVGASKNLVLTGGLQIKLSQTKLKDSFSIEPLASSMLSENAQGIAPFSSRGPTQDGRLKPEIVAPGTNILSVHSQHPKAEPLWGLYNKDYAWSGGTSMATPLVAGAATVLRQYLVEDRKIASPSAALMKAVLMHTAFEMYPGQFGEGGKQAGQELLTHRPNMDEGYGRVDMDRATNLGGAILIDEKTGLATGEAKSYPIQVGHAATLTATMVYTDAAASASAAKALVNDLDLVLVDANGQEVSLGDHTNNSEMIERAVPAGAYSVKVKGASVPQGPAAGKQPYALVLSVN